MDIPIVFRNNWFRGGGNLDTKFLVVVTPLPQPMTRHWDFYIRILKFFDPMLL